MQHDQPAFGVAGNLLRGGQHCGPVGLLQGRLTDDHQRGAPANFVRSPHVKQPLQGGATVTSMMIIIGQINRLTNQNHIGPAAPCLTNARVQHRRFIARIGADQQDTLGRINILDQSRADIGPAIAGRQMRAIGAALNNAAQTPDHRFQGKCRLDRGQIANQTADRSGPFQGLGGFAQRLVPTGFAQAAMLADIGRVQPLTAQPVPDKAGLVGNPFLVHPVMIARQDAHHFAPLGINADVGPQGIHHVDALGLAQLPWPGGKGVGFGGQRPHRAQVDDVALQVAVQHLVQIGGDLGVLAAPGLAHLADAGNLGGEAHAAGAGNTAGHRGGDQRPEVQFVHHALGLSEAAAGHTVSHGLILQITLATLIADRTVERMVDQQKLHHPLAGAFDHGRVGPDQRGLALGTGAQIAHLHGAGGDGLGRPAHHLDQTHAAIAGDRQAFMIAEPGDFHPGRLAGLDQGHGPVHLDLGAVDVDLLQVRHGSSRPQ